MNVFLLINNYGSILGEGLDTSSKGSNTFILDLSLLIKVNFQYKNYKKITFFFNNLRFFKLNI